MRNAYYKELYIDYTGKNTHAKEETIRKAFELVERKASEISLETGIPEYTIINIKEMVTFERIQEQEILKKPLKLDGLRYKLKIHSRTLVKVLNRLGLEITKEEYELKVKEETIKLYEKGATDEEVAEALSIGKDTLRSRKNGLVRLYMERNPEVDMNKIIKMFNYGKRPKFKEKRETKLKIDENTGRPIADNKSEDIKEGEQAIRRKRFKIRNSEFVMVEEYPHFYLFKNIRYPEWTETVSKNFPILPKMKGGAGDDI